jgi:hypothetical protein
MDYKDALSTLTMFIKNNKNAWRRSTAIAFLLVTIPVFNSGVLYADSGDNDGDYGDGNTNCDHGDGNNDNHDSDNE